MNAYDATRKSLELNLATVHNDNLIQHIFLKGYTLEINDPVKAAYYYRVALVLATEVIDDTANDEYWRIPLQEPARA